MDRDIRRALARKYNGMKQRCYNPKNSEYKNYGARGIGICEEWLSNPDSFFEWGVLNGYEKGLTIDRIDVNRGYEPENCRWATMAEQQSNKRSNVMVECNGEMVTLAEASRRIGISESAVWMRIKREIQVDMEPYKWEKPVIRDAGAIFHSVKEAAKSVGVHDTKVSAVCKGNRKTTGGHSFTARCKAVTSFFELTSGVMLPSGTAASGQTARARLSANLPATVFTSLRPKRAAAATTSRVKTG